MKKLERMWGRCQNPHIWLINISTGCDRPIKISEWNGPLTNLCNVPISRKSTPWLILPQYVPSCKGLQANVILFKSHRKNNMLEIILFWIWSSFRYPIQLLFHQSPKFSYLWLARSELWKLPQMFGHLQYKTCSIWIWLWIRKLRMLHLLWFEWVSYTWLSKLTHLFDLN